MNTIQECDASRSSADILHKYCTLLASNYIEAPDEETMGILRRFLALSDARTQHFIRGRLELHRGNEAIAISEFSKWISKALEDLAEPPAGIVFHELWEDLYRILSGELPKTIGDLVIYDLYNELSGRWPQCPAQLTVEFLIDIYDGKEFPVESLLAALQVDPEFWPARLQLAMYYNACGKFADARKHFKILAENGVLYLNCDWYSRIYAIACACSGHYGEAVRVADCMLETEPSHTAWKIFASLMLYRGGGIAEARESMQLALPRSSNRGHWLWVTGIDYYQEDDDRDRAMLDPYDFNHGFSWSCDEDVRDGDFVLLYRSSPMKDIAYIFVVESGAYEVEDCDCDFECNARSILKFDCPVTLDVIRENFDPSEFAPLRSNFQRGTFQITKSNFEKIVQLATATPESPRGFLEVD